MRSTVFWSTTLGVLLAAALSPSATAQYSPQTVTLPGKRVQFLVPDKLGATPLQLGTEGPHLVARFEPTDAGDYIWGKYGTYPWGMYVYTFGDGSGSTDGAEKLASLLSLARHLCWPSPLTL